MRRTDHDYHYGYDTDYYYDYETEIYIHLSKRLSIFNLMERCTLPPLETDEPAHRIKLKMPIRSCFSMELDLYLYLNRPTSTSRQAGRGLRQAGRGLLQAVRCRTAIDRCKCMVPCLRFDYPWTHYYY